MDKENVLVRVYELRDPRDLECKPRYVGITTKTLKYRLSAHINNSKRDKTHKSFWIKSLLKNNIEPTIHLIEEVIGWNYACSCEKYWIKEFKFQRYKLTNGTLGGDGALGKFHSEATKQKIQANRKKYVVSQETRNKISRANKGRSNSPEAIEKTRLAHIGIKHSEETKKKIGLKHKGKKLSEKTKKLIGIHNKNNKFRLGKIHSKETIEKIKNALKGENCYKYIKGINRELFIVDYLYNNMTCVEIGKKFGINYKTVSRYLKSKGVIVAYRMKRNKLKELNNL